MMHIHRWTKWGGIEPILMLHVLDGRTQEYQQRRQSRICTKCGKIQECAIKVF